MDGEKSPSIFQKVEGSYTPWTDVMHKWGKGDLHSGSKSGPKVKNQKQAVAIMLSEKRAAQGGKKEYKPSSKSSKALKGLKAAHK